MIQDSITTFFCPTRLYMGTGAYAQISELLRKHQCKRLFITVDQALLNTAFYASIQALLKAEGVEQAHYSDIEPDPSVHTVERAFDACQQHGATMMLAVGGGSTIDVAKAVGILATNGGKIHDYEGIEKFHKPGLTLIAVPTTAGTGSEISGSCVITDTEANRKMSIRHAALNPATYAILDPLALRTVPAHVAAHSGMDAFVHAFESYISRQANLVTDAINLQAIELLAANLRPFVANRENAEAGLRMLTGSAMAGMTFGQTGLGNVHCMARFVGAACHVSHGLSNAVCLPHVSRFNMLANPAKFAQIAKAMGCPTQGLPELEAAHAAIQAIDDLCRDLDIPPRLRDIGATHEMLENMAKHASEAGYNRWNPRHTSLTDFRNLFERAY
jgi:alcohol dehydrogenase